MAHPPRGKLPGQSCSIPIAAPRAHLQAAVASLQQTHHRPVHGSHRSALRQHDDRIILCYVETEFYHRHHWPTRTEARTKVTRRIEVDYNPRWHHSALGYQPLVEFEQHHTTRLNSQATHSLAKSLVRVGLREAMN